MSDLRAELAAAFVRQDAAVTEVRAAAAEVDKLSEALRRSGGPASGTVRKETLGDRPQGRGSDGLSKSARKIDAVLRDFGNGRPVRLENRGLRMALPEAARSAETVNRRVARPR